MSYSAAPGRRPPLSEAPPPLSEGTLVVTSPNGTPTLGTWSTNGGTLTMVEEGLSYQVDILRLSETEFRIRSNNPGGSVEIRLVPAEAVGPQ